MPLNSEYQQFCKRWIAKSNEYKATELNQCFDKFFTLFVVYNALYVETTALLHRKAADEGKGAYKLSGNSFPDTAAATKFVLDYLGSKKLLQALEANDQTRKAIEELKAIIQEKRFYIHLDPVWGKPLQGQDANLLSRLNSNASDDKARALLEVIYQVRCNMFHGRKGLTPVQMELLLPIISILENVISTLYKKLETEKYIPDPV